MERQILLHITLQYVKPTMFKNVAKFRATDPESPIHIKTFMLGVDLITITQYSNVQKIFVDLQFRIGMAFLGWLKRTSDV